jgi:hypothetical protein
MTILVTQKRMTACKNLLEFYERPSTVAASYLLALALKSLLFFFPLLIINQPLNMPNDYCKIY